MRIHTQLKMFFALLIALTTLTNQTAPAQVTGAASSKRSVLTAAVPGARQRAANAMGSSPSLFLPPVTYYPGSSGGAMSIAVGDVNLDGHPDLVVANYGGDTVGVLLGKGDGTFQPAVTYSSGGVDATSVAIVDVNGDGKPDLVVANFYANSSSTVGSVGVLLGNGDGTFRPAVVYNAGPNYVDSMAVADVNGDGTPDLLVVGESGTVGVLLGNGDGTFQSPVLYRTGAITPSAIAVADLNGDGRPDLLIANECVDWMHCVGAVGVLLGNGDGTFQPAVLYETGGPFAWSVAVADLNGDGKPDLVVANSGSHTVGVLLGNGDGTFQPAATYDAGIGNSASVAVADVNGDGKPDLLVANTNTGADGTLGVLLGNGDGTFQPVVTYDSGSYGAVGPQSIAVADFNGDGKPDLAVANFAYGVVGVLLHRPTPRTSTKTTLISSLNPSIYGRKVTWTATVTSSGSITPTGTVKFTWSIYTIGSATLNSNGVATFSRSNLNADAYPLMRCM